ncbi:flagellar biosynthesis anti-sigma factor FlgM [Alicyclobacillus sendaiensis]|uniref:flagellar biosynthesis anti-sigma factor FlgM n=1 Tax=Alicyclobacillus sendaiensis TaxID=192387 RepID=UPI0007821B52|nr:flagellar biosynthesis anti-sigma factor FlgM [Alicyclobacillus sendaiensis]
MAIPPSSFPVSPNPANDGTFRSTVDQVTSDRLQQLQQAVRDGTYEVNLERIAQVMVERGVFNERD